MKVWFLSQRSDKEKFDNEPKPFSRLRGCLLWTHDHIRATKIQGLISARVVVQNFYSMARFLPFHISLCYSSMQKNYSSYNQSRFCTLSHFSMLLFEKEHAICWVYGGGEGGNLIFISNFLKGGVHQLWSMSIKNYLEH